MTEPGTKRIRRRIDVRGQVQGVGFRPYVYRLATELKLAGSVANDGFGAVIEVEGTAETIARFERELVGRLPPLAKITELRRTDLPPLGDAAFSIRRSEADATRRPEVTPDAATCADCLRELFDPADRRHGYPFINCTNCGPRYSIIRTVPYDRPATTMAAFTMCPPCQREYDDPADRRFHAQPNACAQCGPGLALEGARARGREGAAVLECVEAGDSPIRGVARMLAEGKILAIKGIGGFHLACRADREDVVRRLRERKLRDGKPLALMVPSLDAAREICRVSDGDAAALLSPAAPIVLMPKRDGHGLADGIAPGCDTFGVMLPYAPIHHLLFARGLGPLVMTSANLAGQPLTYRDDDAQAELADVADAFLLHNREIYRPIDDSVVFTFRSEAIPIRRARGFAPRPLRLHLFDDGAPLERVREKRILAVGGELKSTVCLLHGGEAIVSEHLGDLTNPLAYRHFVRAIERLKELFAFEPDVVVHDLHPQYLSTHYAAQHGVPTMAVQHHHAHVASVMAETFHAEPVIGLSCDGTGYGTDGAVWGCEVLSCARGNFERIGHLRYFPLVGGDAAAIETWRPAAALLHDALGARWADFMPEHEREGLTREFALADHQMASGINAPPTSSLGRVFDAVSYLLGLCRRNRHEAEAAMALEAAAAGVDQAEPYAYESGERGGSLTLSLAPTIAELVRAHQGGEPATVSAARFHETVARMLVEAAERACRLRDVNTVALSGGCFANRRLLARVVELLESQGRQVRYHRQVPSGDGGIALGQALVAAWRLAAESGA